jgi:hypothetical protein
LGPQCIQAHFLQPSSAKLTSNEINAEEEEEGEEGEEEKRKKKITNL